MPRDYKNSRSGKQRPGSAWLPFATGLALGLFAAFVVFLQTRAPHPPSAERQTKPPAPATSTPATPREKAPAADAAARDEATPDKPRFDFYTILPEMEVKVPEWEIGNQSKAPPPELEQGSYVLQVGSFQRFEEADRAKAELALQGFTADIQRVVINGQDVWFRVRIGPFTDFAQLQEVRSRLIASGKDFMLLRIKNTQPPP